MYKVMIADDELIIREGVSTFIDWKKLNCQVVYAASDGLEAISYLNDNQIDIVITDIRMPGKSGLELASYIKEHSPYTKIIILTGYSDFVYAQEALRQGAFDFILKSNPLNKIENAVLKAIEELKYEQKEQSYMEGIKKTFCKSQEELKTKFYQDLIYEVPLSIDEIAEKSKLYGISEGEFYCILLYIRNTDSSSHPKDEFINSVTKFLRNIFISNKPVIFPIQSKYLCMVLNNTNKLKLTPLVPALNQLFRFAEKYPSYKLNAAISCPHNSIAELSTAYLECRYCFKKNAKSKNNILFYSDVQSSLSKTSYSNHPPLIEKVLQYIEKNYREQITLSNIADNVGLNSSYLSRLFKEKTGKTITEYLTQLRINKAKELLKDESMRLQEIAEAVGFNDVSYFSNTFKKVVGSSPTEFRTISLIF